MDFASKRLLQSRALFNLACEYALTGDREKALETVAKAVDAGYRVNYFYESDPDLASIREEPRFKALLSTL